MNELRRRSDLKRGEEKKELWPQKTSRPLLFSLFSFPPVLNVQG